jgi:hypothetical protein
MVATPVAKPTHDSRNRSSGQKQGLFLTRGLPWASDPVYALLAMICGVTLAISGAAFLVGAFCSSTWGAAERNPAHALYLTGGLLVVAAAFATIIEARGARITRSMANVRSQLVAILTAVFSRGKILNWFRLLVGLASIVLGIFAFGSNHSLRLAVLLFGIFAVFYAALDAAFQAVRVDKDYIPADYENGLREFAASFVATSGVILGLLSVFGEHKWSDTVKVGVIALTVDILVGIALVALLLAGAKDNEVAAWGMIRYVFNLAIWSLSFGLLCVATGLLYR